MFVCELTTCRRFPHDLGINCNVRQYHITELYTQQDWTHGYKILASYPCQNRNEPGWGLANLDYPKVLTLIDHHWWKRCIEHIDVSRWVSHHHSPLEENRASSIGRGGPRQQLTCLLNTAVVGDCTLPEREDGGGRPERSCHCAQQCDLMIGRHTGGLARQSIT